MKLEAGFQSQTRLRYPEWQAHYEEALIEFDAHKLPQKIAIAETAILKRAEAIWETPLHRTELQAMEDALVFLRAIKPVDALCS
jgi:hypothetical protein